MHVDHTTMGSSISHRVTGDTSSRTCSRDDFCPEDIAKKHQSDQGVHEDPRHGSGIVLLFTLCSLMLLHVFLRKIFATEAGRSRMRLTVVESIVLPGIHSDLSVSSMVAFLRSRPLIDSQQCP